MFEKLIGSMTHRAGRSERFDPSTLGDPVAVRTAWTPAASGGTSFRTHRLVQRSANRVEFAPTLAAKAFYLLFLLAGSGVLVFQVHRIRLAQVGLLTQDGCVPILVGAVFVIVGACMYWFGSTPRVFDRAVGAFWRGRKAPSPLGGVERSGSCAPLSSIHALQLLCEYVSGSKQSFYSYELNLVLDDGRRIHVVDHGNLERLRADAQTLSLFLDKPVWDATLG